MPTELVATTVKLPKAVLDFYQALWKFTRSDDPLDEYLGDQITSVLISDLDNCNSDDCLLDSEKLKTKYDLHKLE